MNFDEMIEGLRLEMLDCQEQCQSIQAKADAEKRELTEDEAKEIDRLSAEFEAKEEEIGRRVRLQAQQQRLTESLGTKAAKQEPEPQNAAKPETQGRRVREPRIEVIADKGKWGWRSFGEFAAQVQVASMHGGRMDPRLIANAPSTYGSEGVGEEGGFLVPPDFRQEIMTKVMGVESLLSRTDQLTTASNSITFPADEDTPWSSSGIQAYWLGENATITASKPLLEERQVRLHKLTCLVPVTEELMQDAPALDGYLRRKVPEKFDYKIQNAIVAGTGAGQPVGILNSTCLVTVAKDTTSSPTQAASTVTFRNIVDIYNRVYAPCRSRGVWLINPDVEAQLQLMQFSNNSGVTPIPVYLPANSVSGAPYATLMGRPVLVTEACSALGTAGDIIFADLSQYLTVVKSGGIRTDVSIHLYFDSDSAAFRFIFRCAGMPWWKSAITPANSSNTRSCFVTVAAR